MKYLFTAFAITVVVLWAVSIYLRIGTRTLLAFVGLLASIAGLIFAVTSLGLKTVKAIITVQVVGFGLVLSLVALFIYFWGKDSEERAGWIYRRERR
jgi:uncharacterized membrane protein